MLMHEHGYMRCIAAVDLEGHVSALGVECGCCIADDGAMEDEWVGCWHKECRMWLMVEYVWAYGSRFVGMYVWWV